MPYRCFAACVLALAVGCGSGGGGDPPADAPVAGDGAIDAGIADARVDGTMVSGAPLDDTVLHDISITIASADDLVLFDQDQTLRVPCDVVIDGATLASSACRKKGSSGSNQPVTAKPAFSIKFDEYVPGQTLAGLDKLTLNNAVSDPSLMNEYVTYEVFRRAGIPAHRTAFAQVSLNGVAKGIYVVLEPVDREFLRDRYGVGQDTGNLYESQVVDFATEPAAMDLKDETGRSRTDLDNAAAAVLNTADGSFEATVGALIDLPEFFSYFAVEIAVAAEDGLIFGRNNYYMYHRPDTDRFVFLPHGQDVVLGNPALEAQYPPPELLAMRVHAIPSLRGMVDAALAAAIAPGGAADPTFLAARIDAAMAVISSTQRTDDFTVGDVAQMTLRAPVMKEQLAWRATWLAGTAAFPTCSDGVVHGSEQCDDGNLDPGDGCDAECLPECTAAFTVGGSTWRLCPAQRDWATQLAACQALGGALAYPQDAADAATMASIVRRRLGNADVWLDLTDAVSEGTWRTSAGVAAPFLAFPEGEPNGTTSQNCLTGDGDLHRDRGCDEAFAALCRLP